MSLRTKTLLIVSTTAMLLFAVVFVTESIILLGGFARIEEQAVRRNAGRVLASFNDEIAKVDATTTDWATWDDSNRFVQDNNPEYIATNLTDVALAPLDMNLVVYLDGDGKIIYGTGFDTERDVRVSLPEEIAEEIASGELMPTSMDVEGGRSGILLLPAAPIMIAVHPILPTDGTGLGKGTLIMGRYLDQARVARLAQQLRVELDLEPFGGQALRPAFAAANTQISANEQPLIETIDDRTMAAYTRIPGITGQPAVLIQLTMPREISGQAQVTIFYQLGSLLLICVVFVVVVLVLLERLIVARLARLSADVRHVRASGDLSIRMNTSGKDEVSHLGDEINGMLDALELAQIRQRRIDSELLRAKDAAEAASRAKSDFLASMSHELRTPLTAIIGYSELLKVQLARTGQSEIASDIERIWVAGNHLLVLISDVLDLSKIEAGKMRLDLEHFSLDSLLADLAVTARPLMQKNQNRFLSICDTPVGIMYSDQTKVRQILLNLLSNAAKFTEKGNVTLRVERESNRMADWVVFRVTDTGIGMSPSQVHSLFEAFTQADPSMTRRYGGTGLGLALSRHICTLLGGEITVTSQERKGSTFTVRLPVSVDKVLDVNQLREEDLIELTSEPLFVPEAPKFITAPAPETLDRKSGLVLVIDDDPGVRDLLPRYLSSMNMGAIVAATGDEGLKLAAKHLPDVITLDVLMPGMNGWDVLSALKQCPVTADIPVLMLSIVDDRESGFLLGATEYLTKPIDATRLGALLSAYKAETAVVNRQRGEHLLVVDDDPAQRQILRQTIEMDGWDVIEAATGREALRRITECVPALIVLDLMLQDVDGIQIIDVLRETSGWRDIPVVVLASSELTAPEYERLNASIIQVLRKGSYSRDELLRQVRQLLATVGRIPVSAI